MSEAETCAVLEGQSRWTAANILKLKEVPTREVHLDGFEAERFLIESNRHREKTKAQRIKEYKRLKEIEKELAKLRQRAHAETAPGKKSLRTNLSTVNKGRARTHAAATVGLSENTAEKGLAVLNRAEAGDVKAKSAVDAIGTR
jgi:ParB-like chromosome segregation protein Spo0J